MLWKNISTFKYFIRHINNTIKNEAPKTTTENKPLNDTSKKVENDTSKTAIENKPINEPISGGPQISKEN